MSGKDPIESAHWVMHSRALNAVHNSYASEGDLDGPEETIHHFVTLLPGLALADGMKDAPVAIMDSEGDFSIAAFAYVQQAVLDGKIGEDICMISLQRVDN